MAQPQPTGPHSGPPGTVVSSQMSPAILQGWAAIDKVMQDEKARITAIYEEELTRIKSEHTGCNERLRQMEELLSQQIEQNIKSRVEIQLKAKEFQAEIETLKAENSQLKSQVEATAHHRLNVVSDIYTAQDRHPEEVERANDVFGYGVLNVFNNPIPSTANSPGIGEVSHYVGEDVFGVLHTPSPVAGGQLITNLNEPSGPHFATPNVSGQATPSIRTPEHTPSPRSREMSTTFDPSEGTSSSAAPSSPEAVKASELEDAAEEVRSLGYTEADDSITAVAQESDYEMHASDSEDGAVSDDRSITSPGRFPRFDWPIATRSLKETPTELLEDDGGESSVMDCLEIQASLDTEDEDPGQVSGPE